MNKYNLLTDFIALRMSYDRLSDEYYNAFCARFREASATDNTDIWETGHVAIQTELNRMSDSDFIVLLNSLVKEEHEITDKLVYLIRDMLGWYTDNKNNFAISGADLLFKELLSKNYLTETQRDEIEFMKKQYSQT